MDSESNFNASNVELQYGLFFELHGDQGLGVVEEGVVVVSQGESRFDSDASYALSDCGKGASIQSD